MNLLHLADAIEGKPCSCGHSPRLHDAGAELLPDMGACTVSLPPFEEEELPAWVCPCALYVPAHGPWIWHQASGSWSAVS